MSASAVSAQPTIEHVREQDSALSNVAPNGTAVGLSGLRAERDREGPDVRIVLATGAATPRGCGFGDCGDPTCYLCTVVAKLERPGALLEPLYARIRRLNDEARNGRNPIKHVRLDR